MGNAANKCDLHNDTKYEVDIVDYDGTRTLYPGTTQSNWLLKGGNYYITLVMKFARNEEKRRNFYGSEYEYRTHNMSYLFADQIRQFERKKASSSTTPIAGL